MSNTKREPLSNRKGIEAEFKPDFNDELFRVEITVYKNGTVRQVKVSKNGYQPTYHEIIGAIEVIKAAFLREVGEVVSETYAKHKAGDDGSSHGG
jgi:tRNA U54 and U55 pseudouridine synthase Pus10